MQGTCQNPRSIYDQGTEGAEEVFASERLPCAVGSQGCGNPWHGKQHMLEVYIGLTSNHKFREEKSKHYQTQAQALYQGNQRACQKKPQQPHNQTKLPILAYPVIFFSYFVDYSRTQDTEPMGFWTLTIQ